MARLRDAMALHGFESNQDYDYPIRCFLNSGVRTLRCLNIEGDSNRRKTAFAMALAAALDYPRVLYHDFTQQHPPQPEVILPPSQDELGRSEAPIEPLDQVLSEACAFSEAEDSILILDQLQDADFREHIRLYQFLRTGRWEFRDASFIAHPGHLLVFLISEQPLYHSLQKLSFRVWVHRAGGRVHYRPEDFGLGHEAAPLLDALGELFEQLGTQPTRSEYERILHDAGRHIRTADGLRYSIFGWTEGIERNLLFARELEPQIRGVLDALETFIGVDEVEIRPPDGGDP